MKKYVPDCGGVRGRGNPLIAKDAMSAAPEFTRRLGSRHGYL